MKRTLNLVILNTAFHQLNRALKSKFKTIIKRHQQKLTNLSKQQEGKVLRSTTTYMKNVGYNFSSY